MLERIGINLSLSFIYILLFRHLITPTVIVNTDFQVIILYFFNRFFVEVPSVYESTRVPQIYSPYNCFPERLTCAADEKSYFENQDFINGYCPIGR